MMKKLLILGGSNYAIPVINKAHELGLYAITADYLPDNPAHKHADEYGNVSVIDKEAVLKFAQEKEIDGIVSFACDPGVVSAAYVAEKMGLPFQGPYKSVEILQDKGLFRQFLTDNGFKVPHARRYTDAETAVKDVDFFTWPVIVKPVDSAGSKSVTKVEKPEDLPSAIEEAYDGSHSGAFVIEDFITFESYHSSSEVFTVDGKVVFNVFADDLFDDDSANPYVPALDIWPGTMKQAYQDELNAEVQRLMTLLDMKTGIYNLEVVVGKGGIPYIMECSPRGGGGRLAEIIECAYGVPLLENEVRKAVGMPLLEIKQGPSDGHWAVKNIHTAGDESGVFKSVTIDKDIEEKYIKYMQLYVNEGDYIHPFTGANMSMGDMFIRCDTREQLNQVAAGYRQWLHINLE